MEFNIQGEKLISSDGWSIEFEKSIKKFVEFDSIVVVLLSRDGEPEIIRNVFGAAKTSKNIIWQIEDLSEVEYQNEKYIGINQPYTDIVKLSEDELRLFNWDGTKVTVDPLQGKAKSNIIAERKNKRPW